MADTPSTPPEREEDRACEVPFVEQLRGIPKDYRTVRAIQWSDDGRETGHQFIPVGFMMHRAADEIERLRSLQSETAKRTEPEWPTKEEVSAYRNLFRSELDKNMNNSSASPSTEAHQVALCAFVKARHVRR